MSWYGPVPFFTVQMQPTGYNGFCWTCQLILLPLELKMPFFIIVSLLPPFILLLIAIIIMLYQGRMGAASSWLGSRSYQFRINGDNHDHLCAQYYHYWFELYDNCLIRHQYILNWKWTYHSCTSQHIGTSKMNLFTAVYLFENRWTF